MKQPWSAFARRQLRWRVFQSDNVVRVSDFGVAHDGRIFFVMELVEENPCSTVLSRDGRWKE